MPRDGRTIRQRLDALGFRAADPDDRVHDLLDAYEARLDAVAERERAARATGIAFTAALVFAKRTEWDHIESATQFADSVLSDLAKMPLEERKVGRKIAAEVLRAAAQRFRATPLHVTGSIDTDNVEVPYSYAAADFLDVLAAEQENS